jgi:anti-sigma regulatory factor (Ser/Thr protein kinase)
VTEPRSASVCLTAGVESLGSGRRFIESTLRAWHLAEQRIEAVLLVANELMTNAIVHAHSAPAVSLAEDGPDLCVRVADASRAEPVVQGDLTPDAHGLGLMLVDALSDGWGCETNATGKTVWVRFTDAFR